MQPTDLVVSRLRSCRVPSPLQGRGESFVDDTCGVLAYATTDALQPFLQPGQIPPAFEAAGPRSNLFFAPEALTGGIVTGGGLCPGLNDVMRSIVLTLMYNYGIQRILGFRYGYAGLSPHAVAVAQRQRIEPHDETWQRVLDATGQPTSMAAVPAG